MKIIGHVDILSKLKSLLDSKKLPNTILFTGSTGIGKHTIALGLAQSIFCENKQADIGGCGTCKNCKLNTNPDLYLLDCKDKQSVDLKTLREILRKLSLKSYNQEDRVVIFNHADHISVAAANLLLKSLEEPRENLYFILVTSNPSRLPQTVLSRCQTWYFNDLSNQEIEEIIQQDPELTNLSQDILSYANGSLDTISRISADAELWEEAQTIFTMLESHDLADALSNLKPLTKNRDSLDSLLVFFQVLAREKLFTSVGNELQKWSMFLYNLSIAEYYIFSRNINATYLLNQIFIDSLSTKDSTPVEEILL